MLFNKYINSSGIYFFRLKKIEATKNRPLQRETTNDAPYFSNQCNIEKDKLPTKSDIHFQQEEATNNSVAKTTTSKDFANITREEKRQSVIVSPTILFQQEEATNYDVAITTDSEDSTNTIQEKKRQSKVVSQTAVFQPIEATKSTFATTTDSEDSRNNTQDKKRQSKLLSQTIVFQQKEATNNSFATTTSSKDYTNNIQEKKRQSKTISQAAVFQQKEAINNNVATTTGSEDSTNTTQEEKRLSKIVSQTIVFQQEEATNNDVATTTDSGESTNKIQEEKRQSKLTLQTVVFQQKDGTKNIAATTTDSKDSENNTQKENKRSKTIQQRDFLKKIRPKSKISIKNMTIKINNKLKKITHITDLTPESMCDTLKNDKIQQSSLGNFKDTCDLKAEIKAVSTSRITTQCFESDSFTRGTGDAISLNTIEIKSSLQQTTVGISCVQLDSSVDKSIHDEVIRPVSSSAEKDKCENEMTDTGESKINLETSSLFNDEVCTLKNNTNELKNKSILHIMEVQNRLRQNLLKRKMQSTSSSAKQPRNIHEESDENNIYLETLRKNLSTPESTDKINLSEKNQIINNRDSSFLAETSNLGTTENDVLRLSESPVKKSNPKNIFNQKLLPSRLSISSVSEKSGKNASENLQSSISHLAPIEKSDKPNFCVKTSDVCSINNIHATSSLNEFCVDMSKSKTSKKSNKLNKLLNTSPPSCILVEETKQRINFEEKSVYDGLASKLSQEVCKTSRQSSEQSTHQDTTTKTLKSDNLNVQNCTAVEDTSNVTKESVTYFHQPNVASNNTSSQHKTNTYSFLNRADSIVKGSSTVDTIIDQVVTSEENNTSNIISDKTKQNEDNILAVSDNTVSSSCTLENLFSRDHLSVNNRSQNVLGTQLHPLTTISSPEELRGQSLRNAEFNKLIGTVFQLYKKFFQPYRGNQRVPLDIKSAAIKCFELMKRDPVVNDNDVLYIMLKTYFLKFKETTEINITKVAEVLHLSIADHARCTERLNSARKLTSSSLREQEKTRAVSEYHKSINSRSKIFKNIFNYFLDEFKEETPILLMPLYFRITQALLRFDTANAAHVYLVRKQILCLLKNEDGGFPITSSLKDVVFNFLTFPDEGFVHSFTFVKELLISFFMLAGNRAEAREVLEFAKFEPCSPQLQQLLARMQQTLNKNQGNKETKTNTTPHATCISLQTTSSRLLSSPTNAVRIDQTSSSPQANVPQDKMNTELNHQIPPTNYMQRLPATKPNNYQQMVTSNQGSIGQVPHSRQQFQKYPHHTYTQNQKPIQEFYEPKQGMQHTSFQQTFQNANQYRGLLVHTPPQATNQIVLQDNYKLNHSLQNVQNKNPSIVHIPNQQTSQTIPQQVNYLPTNIAKQTLDSKNNEFERRREAHSSNNNPITMNQNVKSGLSVPRTKQPPSYTDSMYRQKISVKEHIREQSLMNRGQTFTAIGPEPQTTFTPNLVEGSSIQSLHGIFNTDVAPNMSDLGHYQIISGVSIFIIK